MGQQYSHLSSEERILIEKLHGEQRLSIRRTAERIGRDKSTVSRELRRGLWFASNENGSYRPYRPKRLKTGPWTSGPFYSALAAQRKADLRRRGSRKPRRMDSDRLRAWVLDALRRGWSPELIEGRLKAQCAGDPSMRISHECLYQWIYAKPQRILDHYGCVLSPSNAYAQELYLNHPVFSGKTHYWGVAETIQDIYDRLDDLESRS